MPQHAKKIRIGLAALCAVIVASLGLGEPAPREGPNSRELYEAARDRYAQVGSYIARLTRHEAIKGERQPEEVILLKFRQRPWSAYMKWLGEEGRGREATYVKGQYGGMIHTRLAAGDIPFVPAGRRMALSSDGALMRSASPHPITDLGIGAVIERLGEVLAALGRRDRRLGALRGREKIEGR